jgi:hypothetical protein
MMWFKKLLRRWMMDAAREEREGPKPPSLVESISGKSHSQVAGDAHLTVALRKAVNGHILEMGVYASNPRGPDWTYTHFILPEGESIPDAVAALLVNQRLSK